MESPELCGLCGKVWSENGKSSLIGFCFHTAVGGSLSIVYSSELWSLTSTAQLWSRKGPVTSQGQWPVRMRGSVTALSTRDLWSLSFAHVSWCSLSWPSVNCGHCHFDKRHVVPLISTSDLWPLSFLQVSCRHCHFDKRYVVPLISAGELCTQLFLQVSCAHCYFYK